MLFCIFSCDEEEANFLTRWDPGTGGNDYSDMWLRALLRIVPWMEQKEA